YVALQKAFGKLRIGKGDGAESVAIVAIPLQADIRRVRGLHNLDAVLDELGRKIAERLELRVDGRLAVLVRHVIQRLADSGRERIERSTNVAQLSGIAENAHIGRTHE